MTQDDTAYLSASRIASELGVKPHYINTLFERCQWVQRDGDGVALTPAGEKVGGKVMESPKFGKWIAWPKTLMAEIESHIKDLKDGENKGNSKSGEMLTATALGKRFGIPASRMNAILSELGWIDKALKGWTLTAQGSAVRGVQKEDFRSGIPYVAWPESILDHRALVRTLGEQAGSGSEGEDRNRAVHDEPTVNDVRKKFEAAHRATDGHYVRSKAEMLIDNWLYMAEIVHAYERKLPVDEDVLCDFYIPRGKTYIEYWGLENDTHYAERKKTKQAIYNKYGFNLINLADAEVQNLDDVLPKLLLKFGVQAY